MLDGAGFVGPRRVLGEIEANAEVLEAGADALAHGGGVLADAGREDDGVEARDDGHVGADVFLDAVAEHFQRGLGLGVAGGGGLDDFAHVVDAANALES